MEDLYEQIKALIDYEMPLISNLSNVSALLNKIENINWCGFYLRNGDFLYLGPFQGEIACTKIKIGNGVCGTSAQNKETIIVPDVFKFKGHIACSSASRSEIVTPIIKNNEVVAVIDIDAPVYNRFNIEHKELLEKVALLLSPLFK